MSLFYSHYFRHYFIDNIDIDMVYSHYFEDNKCKMSVKGVKYVQI